MTWKETFRLIKSDYSAYAELWSCKLTLGRVVFLFFSPSIVAVTLYRISRFFFLNQLRWLAWPLWEFNIFLTGADILPSCDIGENFYIGHCTGIVLAGKFGSHVRLFGQACIGGGLESGDVGGGPGLPVIGDYTTIGFRSVVLGPIVIGHHVTIGPMSLVTKPVPDYATAVGNPCRIISAKKEESAS